jgi:hypothetical protein
MAFGPKTSEPRDQLAFTIDVRPTRRSKPRLVTKRAQTSNVVAGATTQGAALLVAAA